MQGYVQVKAEVPQTLKRRFFVLLAQRDQSFADWLRAHMEAALREEERHQPLVTPGEARAAR